jgi:hypothetical protein
VENISKSEMLTWCVPREVLKMPIKVMFKNGYKVMHVNWASQHMTDMDTAGATAKQTGEDVGGKDESEERQRGERVGHSMVLH